MSREWSWYIGQNRRVPDAPVLQGIEGEEQPAPQRENDEWWERVVKAIPTEVVGIYTLAVSTAQAGLTGDMRAITLFLVFVTGWVFTYLAMVYLRGLSWRDGDPERRRAARVQILVALLAFGAWAYSQGGWFSLDLKIGGLQGPLHYDAIGTLLILGVGFLTLISDKLAKVSAPPATA